MINPLGNLKTYLAPTLNNRYIIDICSKGAGKEVSGKGFVGFLKSRGIDPKSKYFVAFGDSASDLDLAIGIYSEGQRVTFAYVGPDQNPPSDTRFQTVIPKTGTLYNQGTWDLLSEIKN